MALGLALQFHLAGVEDMSRHNSADCSLCQAILLVAAKYHLEAHSAVVCDDNFVEIIPETGAVSPRRLAPSVLGPRPPPICTA